MKQISVPGKLMLCGEYAVLEPGSLALVAAIDRYLNITFAPAPQWALTSTHWGTQPLTFEQQWSQDPGPFIRSAFTLGLAYLEADGTTVPPQALVVTSELDGPPKYGLGSSAAVTVAILGVLFTAQGLDIADVSVRERLFRLALVAHRSAQGSGSGADVAAAISGGLCAYTSLDGAWLDSARVPLPTLINEMKWPYLACQSLPWPQDWALAVGWTGSPASTAEFVAEFERIKTLDEERFFNFLFASNAAASAARYALSESDLSAFQQALIQARHLLQEMSQPFLDPIETPLLAQLAELALAYGFAAKLSGAGGGDCGIAVGSPAQRVALETAWQAAGILPLPLQLAPHGVKVDDL
jgi:phosphomevalonate kinase